MTASRYSAVAIALHWTIALLIAANIGLAWYFDDLHGLEKIKPLQFHKPIGIAVLVLTLVRIGWRLTHKPPPLPPMPAWERWTAHVVHFALYAFMLLMPLSGWAMVSASRTIRTFPISFGVFTWPAIAPLANLPPDRMRETHELFERTHTALAWLAYGLVALHVGAALMHQFIRRDSVLHRMAPLVRVPGR